VTTDEAVPAAPPLVFVTVGTDVHRFDRLIDWVEQWTAGPGAGVECVVQHGTSRAPAGVRAVELLPLVEVMELMRRATVVVTQGGPGSIIDCRDSGHLPIVVPRRHALGEHVDDHQLAFTARLQREGYLIRVDTQEAFTAALAAGLADPPTLQIPAADPTAVPPAAQRFGEEVEALVQSRRDASGGRRGRRPWRR
jgi:UDP-N-acetylglucosamine transferase subunit ALG13